MARLNGVSKLLNKKDAKIKYLEGKVVQLQQNLHLVNFSLEEKEKMTDYYEEQLRNKDEEIREINGKYENKNEELMLFCDKFANKEKEYSDTQVSSAADRLRSLAAESSPNHTVHLLRHHKLLYVALFASTVA